MAERKPHRKPEETRGLKRLPGLSLSARSEADEKLIHERLRLAIVSALAVNDTLSFTSLKEMLGASDGNLSVHARKLEEAGFLSCTKGFDGRTPRTEFALTARAWLTEWEAHADILAPLEAPGCFDQRQRERRTQLAAVDDGLLRRALFSASLIARTPKRRLSGIA